MTVNCKISAPAQSADSHTHTPAFHNSGLLPLTFVKFVCGEEGAEILASTGNIPALMTDDIAGMISAMEGFPEDEGSKEALQTANLYLEMPVSNKSSEIEIVLNEAHDNIMTGNSTIDEGIADMNEKVGAVLAQ